MKIFFFYTQICGIFPKKSLTKVVTKILMLRFLWQKSVPRHTVWSSVSKATAFFFIFLLFLQLREQMVCQRDGNSERRLDSIKWTNEWKNEKKLPNLGKHIDKPLDQLWPTLTYFNQSSRTNLEKPGSTWINLTQLAPNRTNSDQPGETWEIWKGFKKPEKLDAISGNLEKFGKILILLTLFEQTCSNLEHPCSGSNWTKPQKP